MAEQKNRPFRRLVFLVNTNKSAGVAAAEEAFGLLNRRDCAFFGARPYYAGSELETLIDELRAAPAETRPELAVIFGGDGTLIAAARRLSALDIPLIGVNLGHLGFLMSLELEDMPGALLRVLDGDCIREQRMQIFGELRRDGRVAASAVAQNDIVINNGNVSRMISLRLWLDGIPALEMKGDGLVVATPTGSTAYSLSAGGSIVLPETDVVLVTPVAAHSLYSRPLVVSAASQLRLLFADAAAAPRITFDGQQSFDLAAGDEIIIYKNPHPAIFVLPERGMFLKKLKAKLLDN